MLLTQQQNCWTLIIHLNTRGIVKHLIIVFLLFASQSVDSETDSPEPNILPLKEAPSIILAPKECRELAYQIKLLSTVIDQTDKQASNLRRAMDELKTEGLIPEFDYTPDIILLNQILSAYYSISIEYSEIQKQRNYAYDNRDELLNKLMIGCNYNPESQL